MKILVVLQNAYNRGALAEQGWHPSRWRSELLKSRAGVRLQRAIPDGATVSYTNAAPGMGDGPDSKLPPCSAHVRARLRAVDPDVVLTCGSVAERTVAPLWSGSLVAIPHPASRTLTNELLDTAEHWISDPGPGRMRLVQQRGSVRVEASPYLYHGAP